MLCERPPANGRPMGGTVLLPLSPFRTSRGLFSRNSSGAPSHRSDCIGPLEGQAWKIVYAYPDTPSCGYFYHIRSQKRIGKVIPHEFEHGRQSLHGRFEDNGTLPEDQRSPDPLVESFPFPDGMRCAARKLEMGRRLNSLTFPEHGSNQLLEDELGRPGVSGQAPQDTGTPASHGGVLPGRDIELAKKGLHPQELPSLRNAIPFSLAGPPVVMRMSALTSSRRKRWYGDRPGRQLDRGCADRSLDPGPCSSHGSPRTGRRHEPDGSVALSARAESSSSVRDPTLLVKADLGGVCCSRDSRQSNAQL